MKDKLVDILLISLILVIFFSYFGIRQLVFEKNALYQKLELTEKYVKQKDWNEALKISKEIKKTWAKHKLWVAANYGAEDFYNLERELNDIIGGIKGKEVSSTVSNIITAKDLWIKFNKIVPEP